MTFARGFEVKIERLLVATMILSSTAAFGSTSHYTAATLAQPLNQKKEFVVNGNAFRCDGSTCVLASPPQDAGSVRTCRALHREVGTLTAYVAEGKSFDADRLAKCNE
jgi:hypothetical protein